MTKVFCVLAQVTGLNPTVPVGKSTGLVFMDVLAIVATGLVLGALLLLWARFRQGRKNRRRHHHRHRDQAAAAGAAANAAAVASGSVEDTRPAAPRHPRRRRRRRDHRPRNPTLGETGGLPPTKIEPNPHPRL